MLTEIYKFFFKALIMHIVNPFLHTALSLVLIEFWTTRWTGWSFCQAVTRGETGPTVMMVLFLVAHFIFAVRYWFFSEIREAMNEED